MPRVADASRGSPDVAVAGSCGIDRAAAAAIVERRRLVARRAALPGCSARIAIDFSRGDLPVRTKNLRVVYTGVALLVVAVVFFFYMQGMAPRSNDPRKLMEIVGQVAGVVGAISLLMIVFGLVGKKPA